MAVIFYDDKANELAYLVNSERVSKGLKALKVVPYLNQCAKIRAEEMIEYLNVQKRPDGTNSSTVIDKSVMNWGFFIGEGFASRSTALATMTRWCEVSNYSSILNSYVTHMGVGCCYDADSDYGWYWFVIFFQHISEQHYIAPGEYPTNAVQTGTVTIRNINTETGDNVDGLGLHIESDSRDCTGALSNAVLNLDTSGKIYFTMPDTPAIISGLYKGLYQVKINVPLGGYTTTPTNDDIVTFSVDWYGNISRNIEYFSTVNKFYFVKVDSANAAAIPGAEMKITGGSGTAFNYVEADIPFTISENGRELSFVSTGGLIEFRRFSYGYNYTITETKPPDGYKKTATKNMNINQSNNRLISYSEPIGVTFTKIAENQGNYYNLPGAYFILEYFGNGSIDNVRSSHDIEKESNFITWVTNSNNFQITALPVGTYSLIETKAPQGFEKADEITFDINENGEVVNAFGTLGEVVNNNVIIFNGTKPIKAVAQKEYITIYDATTEQELFTTHGLAVLSPTSCDITENLNGGYELEISHPIDNGGKWQYFRENNIIKAMDELFTLKTVRSSYKGGKGTVSAHGEQMFYQQSDYWIHHDGGNIIFVPNGSVKTLLDLVGYITDKKATDGDISHKTNYRFTWDSDAHIPDDYPLTVMSNNEGMTPINAIMGSGGILEVSGGELYRDKFYFSINSRMEGANENAFEIRVGNNLTGIERNIDITTMCTHFFGFDEYGDVFGVSWHESSSWIVAPHNIIRSKKYSYSFDNDLTYEEKAALSMERLAVDVMQYFKDYCMPLISYTIDLEEVRLNPDFREFAEKPEYKVGNMGTLFDERLGVQVRLKITQTTTDAIKGKVTKVSFGDTRNFTGKGAYKSAVVDMEAVVVKKAVRIRDSGGFFVVDSGGAIVTQNVGGNMNEKSFTRLVEEINVLLDKVAGDYNRTQIDGLISEVREEISGVSDALAALTERVEALEGG